MTNIKNLGNKQLGYYHEMLYTKIYNLQNEIIEHISDILGKEPDISIEEEADPKKFMIFCKRYNSAIETEKQRLLQTLMLETQEIETEIYKRQLEMLKEIGIQVPSLRSTLIIEKTWGEKFLYFDDMIHYIQSLKSSLSSKEGKWKKRFKNKIIIIPELLKKKLDALWTTRKNVLMTNEWPLPN